jgi:hypothetical protein
LPFKCNLQRYTTVSTGSVAAAAAAAAGIRADAAYRVEGSASGLEYGLHTRYTFEDDKATSSSTSSYTSSYTSSSTSSSVYAAYDYSGRQLASGEVGALYTSTNRVQGREPASFAASFSSSAPLHVPAPAPKAGIGVSACAWVMLTVGRLYKFLKCS